MSSERLKVITLCAYLTDIETAWRSEDYDASKMVKALKGDEIKGFFTVNIKGKTTRFDNSNCAQFVKLIPGAMAKALSEHIE